ncbi:MAG: acyltransferase domain-containing protein [Lachnospiraceae bacterium]|nr:acyltransferase domain-containing protein [Lachnospiraceae bacterium]
MKKTGYQNLRNGLQPKCLPAKFEDAYEKWDGSGHVLTKEELLQYISRYDLKEQELQHLLDILEEIHAREDLQEYISFLVWTQCETRRYEYWIDGDVSFNCKALGENGEAMDFFVCLSCIEFARQDMIRRQIPVEVYEKIPYRMLDGQMEKYQKTGSLLVDDLPWKVNFYSLSIYLFDRFLFCPCGFDDPYRFYRCKKDQGEVIGIAEDGLKIDAYGQLIDPQEITCEDMDSLELSKKDGKCFGRYTYKRKPIFETALAEIGDEVQGNRISPCGIVTKEKIRISKDTYQEILRKGDWMIGFHIPEGEGYTPERVRTSMKLAWDFFTKYFSDLPFKGFWSSSWLYDGRLCLFLEEDSRIVQVQRQFFNYSGGWNGESTYIELFGDEDLSIDEVPQKSSLQKKVVAYLKRGGKLADTGMVYFPEELEKDYHKPIYITDWDLAYQEEVLELCRQKGGRS